MKILFINPAWDGAGCSYRQARAINDYTEHVARHYRAEKTFYDQLDIGIENYNRDEFVALIEEADILHFCSAIHTYPSHQDWGFDWNDYIHKKPKIFHDYNAFEGHWKERAKKKDVWNRLEECGYDALFSSIPQSIYIYKNCVYVPDLVDENNEWFSPDLERDMTQLNLCHFPTGGSNNKNTHELTEALKRIEINTSIKTGITNKEVLTIKKKHNFGFDAIWRGFHGATSVENLSLGIPTMCGIDSEFSDIFKNYFNCKELPFEDVKDINDIVNVLTHYSNNIEHLKNRCNFVRDFMVNKWSAKNIANNIVKEYNKILRGN